MILTIYSVVLHLFFSRSVFTGYIFFEIHLFVFHFVIHTRFHRYLDWSNTNTPPNIGTLSGGPETGSCCKHPCSPWWILACTISNHTCILIVVVREICLDDTCCMRHVGGTLCVPVQYRSKYSNTGLDDTGICSNIRMYLFMSNLFSLNTTTTMTTAINYDTCLTFQNLGQAITVEKWGVIC